MKKAMKKAAIVLAVLVPFLVSCSTPPPPPPPPIYSAADMVYMRELARGDTEPHAPDAITYGWQSCGHLDNKVAVNEVLTAVRNTGWSDYSASVIVLAAVEAYCPQHKGLFAHPASLVGNP